MSLSRERLVARFERAQGELDVYLNKRGGSARANRVQKFLRHPLRIARRAFYKKGILKSPDIRARMFWGAKLVLPLADENAVLAYYTGSLGATERLLTRYLLATLGPNQVFYDVGAHLGLYTSLGEALGAQVHAFEPNPSTVRYVAQNAMPATKVNEVAVAGAPGTLTFFDLSQSHYSGLSSLLADIIPEENKRTQKEVTVEAITLDDYALSNPIPDVLKIDVVNAEAEVLRGAKKLLTEHAPILALRLYGASSALPRTKETLVLLADFGYEPFAIEADGSLAPGIVDLNALGFASTFIFKKQTNP